MTELQAAMATKLQGAQFRWLNEQLYTTTSDTSFKMMSEDPSRFLVYHEGFRSQAAKWPTNPVEVFLGMLRNRGQQYARNSGSKRELHVGDFGCGDAKIAAELNLKSDKGVHFQVHSFDLVSVNPLMTACDIRSVPLTAGALDVAIFSLALMGTNFLEFIMEAQRTLRTGYV